ncbi:MAG: SRPBCC family protein, partial [Gemmatimonadota bacterium]
VRSELGRVVSHPSAIEVDVEDGRVTLVGDVLTTEADRLARRVSRVRGVQEVNNRLRVWDEEESGNVPSLQGSARRRGNGFELSQENWTPAARLLTSIAGGAMAAYGLARRDRFGSALGMAGLALLTRGATNRRLGRVVGSSGGRRGITIQKTIDVEAPVERVFAYLTDWEEFPRWMSHVRVVRTAGPRNSVGERTHWEVDGPAGSTVEWEALTTRFEPNEMFAWKSLEGEPIRQAGRIRFTPTESGGTRVLVELQYNPPAGAVGHAVAKIFGRDPKHQMDDDLARLKTVIETGHPPRDAAVPISVADESGRQEPVAEGNGRTTAPRRRSARHVDRESGTPDRDADTPASD